jgi:hypothetical protein
MLAVVGPKTKGVQMIIQPGLFQCFVFQRLKSNADKLPSLKEIKPHFLIPSNHL